MYLGSAGIVRSMADCWGGTDPFDPAPTQVASSKRRWTDLRSLGSRLALLTGGCTEKRRLLSHHFLLAVANYKRSSGAADVPLSPAEIIQEVEGLPDALLIWAGVDCLKLAKDDESSWKQLDEVRGFGVPTTTALLASLWPDDHLIIDQLDYSVALTLATPEVPDHRRGLVNGDLEKGGRVRSVVPIGWDDYAWMREFVDGERKSSKPRVTTLDIERALYVLGRREKKTRSGEARGDLPWARFRTALHQLLQAAEQGKDREDTIDLRARRRR